MYCSKIHEVPIIESKKVERLLKNKSTPYLFKYGSVSFEYFVGEPSRGLRFNSQVGPKSGIEFSDYGNALRSSAIGVLVPVP